MAIYHLEVKIIKRSDGRSVVAAASYRAAEKITNDYDGIEHDYTKKGWVKYKNIILPDNAPKEFRDRSILWNSVEASEKSKDAQLAREFVIALPVEMTFEQQISVVEKFVRDNLVSQGMIADICIHNPPKTDDKKRPIDSTGHPTRNINKMLFINPHAHILCPLRPMDEHGKWLPKSQKEYLCVKDGEERGFTADEYLSAKEEGWEKQYRYLENGKRIYYSDSDGTARGLEKASRYAKTTPYGRQNELMSKWNSKDAVFEWRKGWENVINTAFENIQSDIRIDCRSFKDQGREDEIPTIHMGVAATNMDKRAERELLEGKPVENIVFSDIGDINRQVREHNRFVRNLKKKIDSMVKITRNIIQRIARNLEGIRAKIIGNFYEKYVLTDRLNTLSSELEPVGLKIERYKAILEKTTKANDRAKKKIATLQAQIDSCNPLMITKKSSLQKKITGLQEQIDIRMDYIKNIGSKYGFSSEDDYVSLSNDYSDKYKGLQKIQNTVNRIQADTEALKSDYNVEKQKLCLFNENEVVKIQNNIRKDMENVVIESLKNKYGKDYRASTYTEALHQTDAQLNTGEAVNKEKNVEKISKTSARKVR